MSSSVQAQRQVHVPDESPAEASLLSRPEDYGYQVIGDTATQSLLVKGNHEHLEWSLVEESDTLTLRWPQRSAPPLPALLAAIEGAFACYPATVALRLQLPAAALLHHRSARGNVQTDDPARMMRTVGNE